MRKIKFALVVLLGLCGILVLSTCRKDENEVNIVKAKISGYVQKGPYINGTSVQMYALKPTLTQTGNVFNTQIINNRGSFEINNVSLSSKYVEFLANGYYFNEITGEVSTSQLTLYALSDITDISTVNVNILTHLEKSRIEYLVTKPKEFSEAKKIAQKEVLAIFGFELDDMHNSEVLDITVDRDDNAILLAISIILQGKRTVGDLTEMLANIVTDIKEDGVLTNKDILINLRNSTLQLDLAAIRSNLENRYKALGINVTIPNFEKFINDFLIFTGQNPTTSTLNASNISTGSATLNGIVNANDLTTTVTFEYGTTTTYDKTIEAIQSPVTGHSNQSVNADISELIPGTVYHFRVKSVNSQGTVVGEDVSFTTLGQEPSFTTQPATNITINSAKLNATVNANHLPTTVTFEYGVTNEYGNIINASQNPITGNINVNVSAVLSDLIPGTVYHFRVKAENQLGTVIGNDYTFTTLGQGPSAIAYQAIDVTGSTATLNGLVNPNNLPTTVLFEYGLTTEYGLTITAIQSPVSGNTSIPVSANISGLEPGKTYHYRIIAENAISRVFSNSLTFNTELIGPKAITLAAVDIMNDRATLTGIVNANSLSTTITFEYGKTTAYGSIITPSQSPISGSGDIKISYRLANLESGVVYHYRIKAENSLGTANGEDMTFSTTTPVTDIDGNTYKTVKIDNQIWMAENLKTERYNDGTLIPLINEQTNEGDPGYLVYGETNTFGLLYNWYAVSPSSNGNRNVCPTGWHVPTDDEWMKMEDYLVNNGYNYDGSFDGNNLGAFGRNKISKALASASLIWTQSTGEGAIGNEDYPEKRNITGFSALPAGLGFSVTGFTGSLHAVAYFWTSTSALTTLAWSREFIGAESGTRRYAYDKVWQLSIRCVKN